MNLTNILRTKYILAGGQCCIFVVLFATSTNLAEIRSNFYDDFGMTELLRVTGHFSNVLL